MEPHEEALRREAKRELRRRIAAVRRAVPRVELDRRAAEIRVRLAGLDAVRAATSVATFWPMEKKGEIDLRPLVGDLTARGVRVAYPRIDEARVPTFAWVERDEDLVPGTLGELSAPPDAPEASALDVIFVPALALAPDGHRLGYGGGFYDRLLAAHPDATAIGVGYGFQLLADLPSTPGDRCVSLVVTDEHLFSASSLVSDARVGAAVKTADGVVTVQRPSRSASGGA